MTENHPGSDPPSRRPEYESSPPPEYQPVEQEPVDPHTAGPRPVEPHRVASAPYGQVWSYPTSGGQA